MKNALMLAMIIGTATLVGACSGGNSTPPAEPLNCPKGSHQEGTKCVINGPLPAPEPAAAPAAK